MIFEVITGTYDVKCQTTNENEAKVKSKEDFQIKYHTFNHVNDVCQGIE